MISLFYYSQLRLYYAKILGTEEDRQVLRFINPAVDSDDEDDHIFEPERSFHGVLNTFMNEWLVKKR